MNNEPVSVYKFKNLDFDPSVEIASSIFEGTTQKVSSRGCLHRPQRYKRTISILA